MCVFLISEECSEGHYYILTSGACQPCPMNFYQPDKGKVACFPCPPDTFTEREGTVFLDECRGECDSVFDKCNRGHGTRISIKCHCRCIYLYIYYIQ